MKIPLFCFGKEKYMSQQEESKDSIVRFYTFILWWFAGATKSILKNCPSDHRYYSNLGILVLLMPIWFAYGAANVASYCNKDEEVTYVVGGLVYVLAVFMERNALMTAQSGRTALFRLVSFILLDAIFTHFIILGLSAQEIGYKQVLEEASIVEQEQQKQDKIYGEEIAVLEKTNFELKIKVQGQEKKLDDLDNKVRKASGYVWNDYSSSREHKEVKSQRERAKQELETLRNNNSKAFRDNEDKIRELKEKKESEISRVVARYRNNSDGIFARTRTLHKLVFEDASTVIFYFVFLFGIFGFEITPVLMEVFHSNTYKETLRQNKELDDIQNRANQTKKITIAQVEADEEISRVKENAQARARFMREQIEMLFNSQRELLKEALNKAKVVGEDFGDADRIGTEIRERLHRDVINLVAKNLGNNSNAKSNPSYNGNGYKFSNTTRVN